MVEEATDGKVTAELKLSLAPPSAQMDLIQDGAADASIIFHSYEGSIEAASVAYWRV